MATSISDNISPAPAVEWRLDSSGTRMVRPLRGVELMVKHSEHVNSGNFNLSFMASFETPLTCEQLKKRFHAALWRTRLVHPVLGVKLDMESATYELCMTAQEANRWAAQTARVASNTTVRDVSLACSRQPTVHPTMTLVVDPVRGSRGCVINISHTLVNIELYRILQEFITQLARPDTELGIDAVFSPETASELTSRLPASTSHAYSLRHKPTQQELSDALQVQERAQMRWGRSSVGIPLRPDWQTRPHYIQNDVFRFEPEQTKAALSSVKRLGMTLTAAFFACITSGIAQMFGTGDEEGAHLLFSGNARRWLDIEPSDGRGPITMSIVPCGMWIDASEVDVGAKDKQGLIRLAKVIERAQEEDLVSPNVIALFDQMAPTLVKGVSAPQDSPSLPSIGRPTLTSQGLFKDDRITSPGHDHIRITDHNTGGRNTDSNVCFALNSFRDELRFNLLYDERFFDQHDVMQLGTLVHRLFRRLTAEKLTAKL